MKLHIARFANAERASWSNFGTSVYIVILPDLGFSPDGQVGVHVSKIPADHRECRRSLMVHEKEGRHFPRFGVVPPSLHAGPSYSVEYVFQRFLADLAGIKSR
jgi:hypothetical protein